MSEKTGIIFSALVDPTGEVIAQMAGDQDYQIWWLEVLIEYEIMLAKHGCQKSARSLAGRAAAYIESGKKIPDLLRSYISEALSIGGDGGSTDQALHLKRSKGQKNTVFYQHAAFASAVEKLVKTDGKTVTDACKVISETGAKMLDGEMIYANQEEIRKYYYEIIRLTTFNLSSQE